MMMKQTSLVPKRRFREFQDNSAWEQRKLGSVTNSYSGGTPSVGNYEYYDGEIPFIRSAEINNDSTELFISESGLKNSSAKLVEVGDILYALYGATSGEVGISRINGAINQAILAIQPYKGYDSQFIMQWLRKQKQKIINKYLQGGQGNLSGLIVKDIEIEFPRFDEQVEIGSFFKELDHLITLHQRKLDKTKALKSAYLSEMFPAEGESEPKRRFAGFTGAWEQRKLGEIATFINGRAYSQNELLSDGKYKVLRVGNFYTNSSWYYSDMELGEKYYAEAGDLLYTWSATFGPHIWHGDKVIYHYHIWKIELSGLFNKQFAVQVLEYDKVKIMSDSNGSTMIHITKKGMEEKEVFLPSVAEQERIGLFFDNLDHLITLHQRKLEKLQNIKKAYLNEMFV
ncbi:restriction endonuclease subunit S [Paenibacillus sp. FSL R7-0331]|uniref:restriction endonuclease subunit S n=1 Tax=Paenibacillus sp. FSL R7-0331 TaxID=1536773 RepID=UPI0009E00E34|nr:restriction endonuclease subunit S [Paenibacillus sp. FSL R7-0331]